MPHCSEPQAVGLDLLVADYGQQQQATYCLDWYHHVHLVVAVEAVDAPLLLAGWRAVDVGSGDCGLALAAAVDLMCLWISLKLVAVLALAEYTVPAGAPAVEIAEA